MNLKNISLKNSLLLIMLVSALSACGGGGSATPINNNPSSGNEPTWIKDQFQPANNYVAQCENPRVGKSPITGETYPDRQGSELLEKFWQRSFNHETYLWYKEVIDKDPNNYSVTDYFDQLKTQAVTDSGKAKDEFHWLQPTSEVEELTQLGISYGYGISYDRKSSTSPREWIVKNITPDTQAFDAGISRGSRLIGVDGVDFVNSDNDSDIDTINNAIFSDIEGETHTFTFIDINDNEYQVDLQTAAISGVPLQIAKTINTAQGKTGYLLLNSFYNSVVEKDLFEKFTDFAEQGVNELIIDLRYNGGGYLALSSQLAYMVAGKEATSGKIYETTVYNDKIANETMPFITETIDLRRLIGGETSIQSGQKLPVLDLERVYVLTTDSSCSASESFMNGLIGIDIEVIQIGSTTCGKPYGFVSEDNCGSTYFTVQFKGENNAGFGDYADGLMPTKLPEAGKLAQVQGCPITEDYLHDLGDENEILLASALYYQANNDCPVIPEKSSRSNTVISSKIPTEAERKLQGKTPLQDAIIHDAQINQFRQITQGGKE